jgi:uncharacterized repeat protein (TIGR02543 family)
VRGKNNTYLALSLLIVILSSTVIGAINLPFAAAVGETIYINVDGSVEPAGSPISPDATNTTYTLTGTTSSQIIVQKPNIILNGNSLTLSDTSTSTTSQAITVKASGVRITNVLVTGYAYGIYVDRSNFTTVDHCYIQQTRKAGIYYHYSSYGSISDNMVFNSQFHGLTLFKSIGNVLKNNVLFNNGYNFMLFGAARSEIVNDIDTTNTVDSKPIYFWVDKTSGTIPLNAGYVALIGCSGITVQNLSLTKNSEGIRLCETSSSYIAYNNITGNVYGILAQSSSGSNTIYRNLILDNGNKPDLSTGTPYGYGISLLNGADFNRIYENNLTANQFGMDIYYSSSNVIYHNFFKNPTQIDFTSGTNTWNDDIEGNYWSDYTGIDANNDGIGDTPKIIGTDNQDNHPLMGAFYTFQADLFGVKQDVNVITNSDIRSFSFNATNNAIKMYVTNSSPGQINGFQRVTIPKTLMNPPYRAIFNQGSGNVAHSNYTLYDNSTSRWVYYAYNHTITQPDQILLTSKYYIVFMPLNLTGTLASYQAEAQRQYDFLVQNAPILQNCSELIIMNQTLYLNFDKYNKDLFNSFSEISKFAIAHNVTGDRYIAISDAQFWISPTTGRSLCDGLSDGGNTVVAKFGGLSVTAHELGHSWGLEDEYSYVLWLEQSQTDYKYPAGFPPNSYAGDDPSLLARGITNSSYGRSFDGKRCIMGSSDSEYSNGTAIDRGYCPTHSNQTSAGLHDFEGCADHVAVAITKESQGLSKGMAACTAIFYANGSNPTVKELQYVDVYGKPMTTSLNSNYSMQVYSGSQLLYSSNIPVTFRIYPISSVDVTLSLPIMRDSITIYWLMPTYGKDQLTLTITDNIHNQVIATYDINRGSSTQNPTTVTLNSSQDNLLTTNIGKIDVGTIQYALPNQIINQTGTFQIQYTPTGVYSFKNWKVSGNIVLPNANDNPTTATINGNGSISAIYTDATEYTISLESKENSNLNINQGSITVNSLSYNLPNSIKRLIGEYTVTFEPSSSYAFIRWETTGSITLADSNSRQTTATVNGDSTLRAIYATGTVHNLNSSKSFATIQSAINDVATQNGHVIAVDAGTYNEQISINKTLTLKGENQKTTTIIGKQGSDVITVTANNVTICGFTITVDSVSYSYDNGIYLNPSNNTLITDNTITKVPTAIQLYRSFFCIITNNNITSQSAYDSGVRQVKQNSGTALYLRNSENSTIANNLVSFTGSAVNIQASSHNCTVQNNRIWNTTGTATIGGSSSNQLSIKNNIMSNGAIDAIRLTISNGDQIVNNSITNYGQDGMFIENFNNGNITDNLITNCREGIYLQSSSNNRVMRNTLNNNKDGIYFWSVSSSIISDNYLYNNNFSPVYSGGISIMKGSIASGNTVNNNYIAHNSFGLWLNGAENTVVTNNTITQNSQFGWLMQESTYTTARNNVMIGNAYNFGVHASTTYFQGWSSYWFSTHDIDTSNTVDGKPIYYWVGKTTPQAIPSDAGYVGLVNCRYITVENLTLSKNWQGILLAGTTYSTIRQNTLQSNHEGLSIYLNSNYNTVANNTITLNPWYGIHIGASSYNNVTQNNVTYNGISTKDSFTGTVGAGISIGYLPGNPYTDSNNNTIQANNITYNNFGVYIGSYPDARISGVPVAYNNIINNNIFFNGNGTYIDYSANNVVYGNHFVSNTQQAYANSPNTWDNGYPAGGNYWSDYTGKDLYSGASQNIVGSDGIGDTAYIINIGLNYKDRYPIVGYTPPPAQTFTLTIASSTDGTTTPAAGAYTYQEGYILLVNATANTGYHLDHWILDSQTVVASNQLSVTINSNHTLQAVFIINQYKITATASTGGSISPSGITLLNYGQSQTFTVNLNTGYHLTNVLIDGTPTSAPYIISNISANHTIVANFALNTYTITIIQTSHGTITPGTIVKDYASNQAFNIVPESGYYIASIEVDGTSVSITSTVNFNGIDANHTLTATYALGSFVISASAGMGGTISPSGDVSVSAGASQTFTVTPDIGYHIVSVLMDGSPANSPYTFVNVDANHTIVVNFAINTYTITVTQTSHGAITPETITKNYGTDQTFNITPDMGYYIINVLVDGNSVGVKSSVTFQNIAASHTLTATFGLSPYYILASAGSGGSITPSGTISVAAGGDQNFIVTPNTGYHIDSLLVDGTPVSLPYNFTNVNANHTIAANFAINQLTIAVIQTGNGIITPGTVTKDYGSSQTFTIAAETGYHIASITVDGNSVALTSSVTFNSLDANHTLTATFAPNSYPLTMIVNGEGSVLPGNQTYLYGSVIGLQAFNAPGWNFAGWSGDATGTSNTSITITGPKIVTATFSQGIYPLTVVVIGQGSVFPGNQTFTSGTNVNLVAINAPGWTFSGWSGDATGSINTTMVMNGPKTVTATFTQNLYPLTMIVLGQGSVTPGNQTFTSGTIVNIQAINAIGWTFAGWSGDVVGTTNTTLTMNSAKTLTAIFTQNNYALTMYTVGNGAVLPGNSTSNHYGDNVKIQAIPSTGWTFQGWSGATTATGNTTLLMDDNKIVTAIFTQNPPTTYTLTMYTTGQGTVTPGNQTFNAGATVDLKAYAATGWTFVGWSGSATGTINTTVTMNTNKEVTATFTQNTYILTMYTVGTGTVAPGNTTGYHYGDIVQIKAYTGAGWFFQSWSGAASGNTNKSITIYSNAEVTGTFIRTEPTTTTTRGQGFWATHTAFTTTIFKNKLNSQIVIGTESFHKTITNEQQLFGAFYAINKKTTYREDRTTIDQSRVILLQQLTAAILNKAAFNSVVPIDSLTGKDIITAANAAYGQNNATEIKRLSSLLDSFNNSGEGEPIPASLPPVGNATPQKSQSIANVQYWDKLSDPQNILQQSETKVQELTIGVGAVLAFSIGILAINRVKCYFGKDVQFRKMFRRKTVNPLFTSNFDPLFCKNRFSENKR